MSTFERTVPNTKALGRQVPRHKHRIANFIQNQVYSLTFAHLGKFAIVAVYFILTQTMRGQHTTILGWAVHLPNVKGFWDHLFTAAWPKGLVILMPPAAWKPMRHIVFRGLLEGVLGVVLYKLIGFNVQKYRAKFEKRPEPNGFDRLILRSRIFASPYQNHPVTGVQWAFLPMMLVLVTICLGVPLYLLLHYAMGFAPKPATHGFWQRLYVGDYDGLVIGVIVGFVASRTYRAYLYDNTMFFARRWVIKGRREHWWMPQHTRELVADMRMKPMSAVGLETQRSGGGRIAIVLAPLVLFALAGYGVYILRYIAK